MGRSGPPFGHFWALFGRFFGVLNYAFFKPGPKMGSAKPSESILGGFSRILGGFWESSGKVWEGILENLYVFVQVVGRF